MAEPIGWHTVSQNHEERYNGDGNFDAGWMVTYMTDSGSRGKKFFPEARYNRENVVNTINEIVGRVHEVAALGN